MRKYFFILMFVSLFSTAGEPLRIGVITDVHYLSPLLMDNGKAVNEYALNSGKNILAVPFILDEVLNQLTTGKAMDVLLVCGDMTKDGEKQSHLDFLKSIQKIQDSGTKVFVIPGNHDINMPNSVGFKENKTYPVSSVSADEFRSMYNDCGYKDAIHKDQSTLSYVAEINENTWLLAIDAARYKEYTSRSFSSGFISSKTEAWVLRILKDAAQKNVHVIGMMHWGLVEHITGQSLIFGDYLIKDWDRLATLFADNGMKVIFTGHFHSNDITAFTSTNGNKVYDIETASLSSYPFAYRLIDFYSDRMDISTSVVRGVTKYPNLYEEDKQNKLVMAEKQAMNKIKNMGFDVSDENAAKLSRIIAHVFVQHAAGDEVLDETLRKSIEDLVSQMDSSIDLNALEFDFPPADNNITITF